MSDDNQHWDVFYLAIIQPQIEKSGEAYIEWMSDKLDLVKLMNHIRNEYKLKVTYIEKYENCYSIFFKPKVTSAQ